jgi:hypothetical protein
MKHHQPVIFAIGLGLLALGLVMRLAVSRNRFNRRTLFGLQEYESFGEAWVTSKGEGCARTIGTLFLLAGILLSLAGLA